MHPLIGNEQLQITGTHAYIVAGALGSGRGRLIELIATTALCANSGANTRNMPCGVCPHCKKMEHHSHPDFQTFGWQKPLTVEQVRELRKAVFVRPNEANYTINVIYQADLLLQGGQNALLKILEEPPKHAIFILVTGESGDLLETIQSRCRKLTLRPVKFPQAVAYLSQRYPNHPDIQGLAVRCGGILGKAVAEIEPKKKTEEATSHPQAELFHQAKKGKQKLPVKKEPAPVLEQDKVQDISNKIAINMINKQELPLLESCISLEKLDKATLLQIFDQLKIILSKHLLTNKTPHLFHCLSLVGEVETGIHSNVGGAQLIGWLTAGTMRMPKGGNNDRNNLSSL